MFRRLGENIGRGRFDVKVDDLLEDERNCHSYLARVFRFEIDKGCILLIGQIQVQMYFVFYLYEDKFITWFLRKLFKQFSSIYKDSKVSWLVSMWFIVGKSGIIIAWRLNNYIDEFGWSKVYFEITMSLSSQPAYWWKPVCVY